MSVTAPTEAASGAAGVSSAPVAVTVRNVSKDFRIPKVQATTLKERALHPLRSAQHDVLHAVRDMNFDVRQGEFFGIVGRNGSGKSTLLKCLAGIYNVDAGEIALAGRVSPFIELGVGFNPDLTARDNVLINAIMLGLTRRQARERFDDIIDFAELHDFLDLKLKNYSSGMRVRLAFSVTVQVDADIVLIDEVLAVGDAAFQQKCFEEFQRLRDEGRTILFVTHDMGMVERFCDRAMLVERGQIVAVGEPLEIARKYNELNFGRLEEPTEDLAAEALPATEGAPASIKRCWFEDRLGEQVAALGLGERCRACFEVQFAEPIDNPVFGIVLRNDAHHVIVSIASDWRHGATGRFAAGERVRVVFQFDSWLAASRYSLTAAVSTQEGQTLARAEDFTSLMMHSTVHTGGVVYPLHEIAVERL